MMLYTLYWGVYPQWTNRAFASDEDAVKTARAYALKMSDGVEGFRLVKQVEIPLK